MFIVSEVAQLCLTLCDPMDCSLPGSSLHGILQTRVLEWGAIAFSDEKIGGSQNKRTWKYVSFSSVHLVQSSLSHVRLSATPWTVACQAPPSMGFSRQEYCSGLPFPSPVYMSELLWWLSGKESACNARELQETGV